MGQTLPGRNAITGVLKAAVDKGDVPAVAAVVVSRSGEIYRDAVGQASVADHTSIAPDAIFRIFSMTKPITSVAAMMLVEEKRIALDDPISKHLSEKDAQQAVITADSIGHFVSRPPEKPVSIRHLLTHTSGIAYDFTSDVVHRVHESAPSIPETSILVAEPGERWIYGPSTRLLGQIVAAVSGQSLDVFFEERIFKPLAMSDTAFTVPDAKRARLVTAHERKNNVLVEQKTPATITPQVIGDSGLYSTASDYGRFVRMLLNNGELDGHRVVSAVTIKEMATNQIGALTIQGAGLGPGAGRDGFGFGFEIATLPKPDPHHRSNGSLSWSGAMNTHFWVDPLRHIGAVLLMQVLPFDDAPARRLLDVFEGAVYEGVK